MLHHNWRVHNHKIVVKDGIRGLLPMRWKKRNDSRPSIVIQRLLLKSCLLIHNSHSFFGARVEIVLRRDLIVKIYFRLVHFFLIENATHNWAFSANFKFKIALRVDVVSFYVKTWVNNYRPFFLFFILTDDDFPLFFIARPRLVIFVHCCVFNKFCSLFVSGEQFPFCVCCLTRTFKIFLIGSHVWLKERVLPNTPFVWCDWTFWRLFVWYNNCCLLASNFWYWWSGRCH